MGLCDSKQPIPYHERCGLALKNSASIYSVETNARMESRAPKRPLPA